MDSNGRSPTPETPSSPLTQSLDLSSSTIDELTGALSDLTSQEPAAAVVCCCRKGDCENTLSWLSVKAHLESRLILSAEVGQALLQKHEEYKRQLERSQHKRRLSRSWTTDRNDSQGEELSTEERLGEECDRLARERAELEKRLNVALVNNEVTEVSNKTLLQELQEARDTISRLTAHHARSMGWDARLTAALKERDDMQQERDSESHRARLAESRFAALKDKTNKLQIEVRRLQEALEEKRQHRLEFSESILSEARIRLESVRKSMGSTAKAEQEGITSVLETLVNDNEVLKRDNAELQRLLSESREDLHSMQEEVEEQRANLYPLPRSGPSTPLIRHFHNSSVTSLSLSEPLTPDSTRRPLSPLDSLSAADTRWNTFNYPRTRRISSSTQIDYDIDEDTTEEEGPESDKLKGGHRTLLLLTRSRAVQTEPWPNPSPMPSAITHLTLSTPPDPRSETSSFSESMSSHVSGIFERATALLNKMSQADALTLTNRLKRQNLKGADLGHLSRTTVSNIVAEAIELRAQYRALLEDEKIVVTCTRKDLRVLFSLLKDMFMELGQLRATLNDVIFDPSCAQRISEHALNPAKALEQKDGNQGSSGGPSWMAPLSRLFSGAQKRERSPARGVPSRSGTGLGSAPLRSGGAPRLAPKIGPALAASTTTVNVEFSGSGVGRATTTTLAPPQIVTSAPGSETQSLAPSGTTSVMDIFAGAPKPQEDPWVVLPKGPRRVQSTYLRTDRMDGAVMGSATLGRSNFKRLNRLSMSRNVDAVIDSEQPLSSVLPEETEEAEDNVAPLPVAYPALRRRGLSDSSIHSTFTSHGGDDGPGSPSSPRTHSPRNSVSVTGAGVGKDNSMGQFVSGLTHWSDGTNSVFQALSRTVQSLRLTTSGSTSALAKPADPSSSAPPTSANDDAEATPEAATAATLPHSSSASIVQSSDPNSPIVQAPSPAISRAPSTQSSTGEIAQPQAIRPPSVLSPQGTPRSSRVRPKGTATRNSSSSRPSTPRSGTRERGESQGSAGLVSSFLPSLAIGSWIPGPAAGDVLDGEPGGMGSPTSPGSLRGEDVFGSGRGYNGTVRPQRRPGRHSEGRASRDFM